MTISELSDAVQYSMDLIGIFAFALSGAFLAVHKDFNIFGTFLLAEAAGLGGGLFRDLVIGVTPVAFTDTGYYLAPFVATLIIFFTARAHRGDTLFRIYDLGDAAALGLFSVTGTIKALSHGLNLPAATTLGVGSAVGGGVLSNILALEVPSALRWNRNLYILPALIGAGTVALLSASGLLNVVTAATAALAAFGLRVLALHYRWHTLRAYVRRNPFAGMRQEPTPPRQQAMIAHPPGPVADAEKTVQIQSPVLPPEQRLPSRRGPNETMPDLRPPQRPQPPSAHGNTAERAYPAAPKMTVVHADEIADSETRLAAIDDAARRYPV